jgi:hypothetical protein
MAAKVYADSATNPQRKAEFAQALNTNYGTYSQTNAQAIQTAIQTLSQAWNTLNQARGAAQQVFAQSAGEAVQILNQTMPTYTGRSADISDFLIEPGPAIPLQNAQADESFRKSVDQARSTFEASIERATTQWKQSIKQQANETDGAIDQDQFRKINRQWSTATLDAMDDLRSAFKTALRRFRLQVID